MPDVNTQIDFPYTTLRESISQCMIMHRYALHKKLQQLKTASSEGVLDNKDLMAFIDRCESSITMASARQASIPSFTFDDQLPISARRDNIAETLQKHQVVILAGETGSGKTTQIPKICLGIGRGIFGKIGHTQPRRLAARTVASRVADELGVELGGLVGYQVRFHDQSQETTLVKLMTDGILLADIQADPYLNQYDTLIIDEAHERSLNIDFLLGYIKKILPKRPDLKVIVTSATIDLERFSAHFNDAPIIEVSGRTFPVETRYRPLLERDDDMPSAIITVLEEILAEAKGKAGDILVFLSGERDIRELANSIKRAQLAHLEVLPLYARLSVTDQQRVFQAHKGRRVILATNVAETSITVPGVRYVIDPGKARISRYSLRTKVQRLPIEAISQASANQRKGRCGRVSDGICYRLYSEEDFLSRPEFTDAELLRTNLAAVVLQMLTMKMGKVEHFPFVDKPDTRLIKDGYKLLEELQAVSSAGKLTRQGRQLGQLSIDPRFGRMLCEAANLHCLSEVLIIVTALTVQDPRERPQDKKQQADEYHRRFHTDDSDFLALVKLWDYVETQRQSLTQNQLRKLCKKEYIHFLRLKEWRELHHQLKVQVKALGWKLNTQAASSNAVHKALLVGLLSNIGCRNDTNNTQKDNAKRQQHTRDYLGTRQREFIIFPGSSLRKKKLPWLMAAEFIETTQLYAHYVAKIDVSWVVSAAQHLVNKQYFEPHYDPRSGSVKAFVKMTLWGLLLSEKQRVDYAPIDAVVAREVFIRRALVEGMYAKGRQASKGAFFQHNADLIDSVVTLEEKARRRDILVDDEAIYRFYDERLPHDIVNLAGFEHWRKHAEQTQTDILHLHASHLMLHAASHITQEQFPDHIRNGDLALPAQYVFEPTGANDGVNIQVPVDLLHQVDPLQLEWLVPGLLREKCIALVKTLPKNIRKQLVPVPDYVDRILPKLLPHKLSLIESMTQALNPVLSSPIKLEDWQPDKLDRYYFANIVVVDDQGGVVDQGREIARLREKYQQQVKATIKHIGSDIEREGLTRWDFEALPEQLELDRGAVKMKAYPALVANTRQRTADITLFDTPEEASLNHIKGVCQLVLNELGQTSKYTRKTLLAGKDIGLTMVNMGSREEVVNDMLLAAVRRACFDDAFMGDTLQASLFTKDAFNERMARGRQDIVSYANDYESLLLDSFKRIVAIKKSVKSSKNALALALTFGDVQAQLDRLFAPGCLFESPWQWYRHMPRYLEAIHIRMEKAAQKPNVDRASASVIASAWQRHEERLERLGNVAYLQSKPWQDYRWMIEELRVSLFAQSLKTSVPVSEKRLKKQWENVI